MNTVFQVTQLSPELAVSVSGQSLVPPAQGLSHHCRTQCRILQRTPDQKKKKKISHIIPPVYIQVLKLEKTALILGKSKLVSQ